jgi:PAS domain S-box-containing protein
MVSYPAARGQSSQIMDTSPPSSGAVSLAQSVFDSIPDPLVVLDPQFRIIAASRAFRSVFGFDAAQSNGNNLFELLGSKWDFPALRQLLNSVAAGETEAFHEAIEHESLNGNGTTLFSAKRIARPDEPGATILLTVTDISQRRSIERDRQGLLDHAEELLRQQSIMLREMEHRVANSLQIIASILLLKAKSVSSEETRQELHDAHKRVLSIAEVQKHLHSTGGLDQIEVSTYLDKLCSGLARSMVKDQGSVIVKVIAEGGVVPSSVAVSLGLIVTELVINAVKHAFPGDRTDGLILVTYERDDADWKLVVSDNGVGKSVTDENPGLGITIIGALAKQLGAKVEESSTDAGLSVSLTHATFTSRMPRAS